jgi:hypothetical protein
VFDPALADPVFNSDVSASLAAAGLQDRVKLIGGRSPEDVEEYTQTTGMRWSLVFIDGDHDGDAPRRDAELISRLAAPSAMVLFHDLMSPDVARALLQMKALGWQVRLYMTTQIMGVAWRGKAEPLAHVPDPAQDWWLPAHLSGFSVSGAPKGLPFRKLENGQWKPCSKKDAAVIAKSLAASLTESPEASKPEATQRPAQAESDGTDRLMDAFAKLQQENAALLAGLQAERDEKERLQSDLDAVSAEAEASRAKADRATKSLDTTLEQVREIGNQFAAREAELLAELQDAAEAGRAAEAHAVSVEASLAEANQSLDATFVRLKGLIDSHAAAEAAFERKIAEAEAHLRRETALRAELEAAQAQHKQDLLEMQRAFERERAQHTRELLQAQSVVQQAEAQLDGTIARVHELVASHAAAEEALRQEIAAANERTSQEAARVWSLIEAQERRDAELLDVQIALERALHAASIAPPQGNLAQLEEDLTLERARFESLRHAKAEDEARLLECEIELEQLRHLLSQRSSQSSGAMSVAAAPPAGAPGTGVRRAVRRFTHRRESGVIKTIRLSGEFDHDWYLKTYCDVASAGADPVEHYVRHGAADGRDPSPNFSTKGYLQAHADVRREGINPLLHYIKFGKAEGRRTK